VVSGLGNPHMSVMLGAACLMGFSLNLKGGTATTAPITLSGLFAIFGLAFGAAAALTVWGGWLGGEMVFKHGAGSRG